MNIDLNTYEYHSHTGETFSAEEIKEIANKFLELKSFLLTCPSKLNLKPFSMLPDTYTHFGQDDNNLYLFSPGSEKIRGNKEFLYI